MTICAKFQVWAGRRLEASSQDMTASHWSSLSFVIWCSLFILKLSHVLEHCQKQMACLLHLFIITCCQYSCLSFSNNQHVFIFFDFALQADPALSEQQKPMEKVWNLPNFELSVRTKRSKWDFEKTLDEPQFRMNLTNSDKAGPTCNFHLGTEKKQNELSETDGDKFCSNFTLLQMVLVLLNGTHEKCNFTLHFKQKFLWKCTASCWDFDTQTKSQTQRFCTCCKTNIFLHSIIFVLMCLFWKLKVLLNCLCNSMIWKFAHFVKISYFLDLFFSDTRKIFFPWHPAKLSQRTFSLIWMSPPLSQATILFSSHFWALLLFSQCLFFFGKTHFDSFCTFFFCALIRIFIAFLTTFLHFSLLQSNFFFASCSLKCFKIFGFAVSSDKSCSSSCFLQKLNLQASYWSHCCFILSKSLLPGTTGVYFAGCMLMCTMTCLLNVLVLNYHHRKPHTFKMNQWVRTSWSRGCELWVLKALWPISTQRSVRVRFGSKW